MNAINNDRLILIARLALAVIFIMGGYGKVTGFEGSVKYTSSSIYLAGFPTILFQAMVVAAIAIELGGGILVAVGWQTRWAALAIALFSVLAALLYHPYWAIAADAGQRLQSIMFWKNIAMAGGFLLLYVTGPGALSVEGKKA
ncbi:MAG: DoxX family protein [Alphaproteobacteria bacterium]|nr:DoxX family protein [Alphaproteobacteria bacterium]